MSRERARESKSLAAWVRMSGLDWLRILGLLPPILIGVALGGWTKAGGKEASDQQEA
jgi:hypothetical protein